MADLLDAIHRQLRERLDELRPLVAEYERLRNAERALSVDHPFRESGGGASRQERPRSRRRRATRPPSSPSERAANRENLIAVVRERPGVTKAEITASTGLSNAGVAQNLRRLLDRGELREEPLPGGLMGYRLGETQDAVPTG